MSISINGRTVKKGDSLYNELNHAWGIITEVEDRSVVITHSVNGVSTSMRVAYEGTINGLKRLSWNAPLIVKTTSSDVSDIQRVVDTYVEERNKWLHQ